MFFSNSFYVVKSGLCMLLVFHIILCEALHHIQIILSRRHSYSLHVEVKLLALVISYIKHSFLLIYILTFENYSFPSTALCARHSYICSRTFARASICPHLSHLSGSPSSSAAQDCCLCLTHQTPLHLLIVEPQSV